MSAWIHLLRRAAPYVIPAVVYLGFLLAVFWRLWTPIDGAARAFGWDAIWEYWGDLQYQADAYAAGELPLWNPHDRGGYPFHADPQAGMLYPPTWALVAIAWIAGSTPWWLIAVKIVFHYWLVCVGLHALLRRWGTPSVACYAGAFVFVLSYPVTQNLFSALSWNIAWAPWAMLAIDRWADSPRWGSAAVVALVMSMCALAGAPGALWYSLLVIAPYGIWALVARVRAHAVADRRDYLYRAAATLGAAIALFVAAIAAQFAATGTLVQHSVRATRDLEFMAFSTFGADDIAGFVIPRNVGGNTYLGIGVVMWIGAMLTAMITPRRLVLACIAAAGVLLALGSQGDFLPVAASSFPPFGFFRRAHRYLYVAQLAIALLGAQALGALLTAEAAEVRRRVRIGIVAVGALGLAVFATGYVVKASAVGKEQPLRDAFALACAASVVFTWLTYMLLRTDGRWRHGFAALAVVALACDLWYAQSPRIDSMMHTVPVPPRDDLVATLGGVAGGAYRVYDRDYLKFRPGVRLGVRDYGGYEDDPLALDRYAFLRDKLVASPRLLGHANVRYLLEGGRHKIRKSPLDKEAMRSVRPDVYELAAAPVVYWTERAVLASGRDRAWAGLAGAEPGQVAVVDAAGALADADIQRAIAELGAGTRHVAGRVVERSRNGLIAEVDAPAAGVVVVNETYYPGWRARVDGRAADIVPVNVQFRGLLVGPGHHRIELEYQPPGFRLLALLSLLSMAACFGLMVWDARRSRPAPA